VRSDALAWLRADLADDVESFREDALWYATARSLLTAWFGLALLFRVTAHHLIYGAIRADDARGRDATLGYEACHVRAATSAEAHQIRLWTALGALALAACYAPVLTLGRSPVAALFLLSNWVLLVTDPLAPLYDRAMQTLRP
jgi:cytochrome b